VIYRAVDIVMEAATISQQRLALKVATWYLVHRYPEEYRTRLSIGVAEPEPSQEGESDGERAVMRLAELLAQPPATETSPLRSHGSPGD
jgi:hypothetical protein